MNTTTVFFTIGLIQAQQHKSRFFKDFWEVWSIWTFWAHIHCVQHCQSDHDANSFTPFDSPCLLRNLGMVVVNHEAHQVKDNLSFSGNQDETKRNIQRLSVINAAKQRCFVQNQQHDYMLLIFLPDKQLTKKMFSFCWYMAKEVHSCCCTFFYLALIINTWSSCLQTNIISCFCFLIKIKTHAKCTRGKFKKLFKRILVMFLKNFASCHKWKDTLWTFQVIFVGESRTDLFFCSKK